MKVVHWFQWFIGATSPLHYLLFAEKIEAMVAQVEEDVAIIAGRGNFLLAEQSARSLNSAFSFDVSTQLNFGFL